ncbi:GFA family protein [Polyangium aurulentum]|uniref:GFA family protein n=1 Tax=Polyangium aurulentum TaxID=2567896 RepID=UPI0010AEDAEA|nr:GFA family protein [Polyangium aurulentum]UQA57586.1 GFA family protein [Polyangium aurulentum]
MTVRGSCHCGRVAYRLEDAPTEAMECNCSICRRKGYQLAFSSPDKFTLETSRDDIAVYTFGSHTIRHQFCKTCGCAPFGEGTTPDGRAMVAINLRCAEGVDMSGVKIQQFDGANMA